MLTTLHFLSVLLPEQRNFPPVLPQSLEGARVADSLQITGASNSKGNGEYYSRGFAG